MGTVLLERHVELELLGSALASAREGRGGVALVAGEAGIGKSSVIRAFTASVGGGVRVLYGACDDLVTPRTLGAIRDAFVGHSARLERILAGGTRDDLLAGVLAELVEPADPGRPTVLVVEDVHWADDATLDVLRYVGRRVDAGPALVVISYRDDEIGRDHPVERLLGGLTGPHVHRLVVPRLTRGAVADLAGGTVATSAAIYELTGGNPFHVTEVVASGDDGQRAAGVPATVADAVLARVHQLDPSTRRALEQLAVIPSQVELSLAGDLLGDPAALTVLAEAERRGVLEIRRDAVAFRHELARRAVENSLAASERMRAHARVLDVLTAADDPDVSRVVHHAVEAGDDARVVELAPRAAARAAHAGSYTQEITYYRLLLDRAELVDETELAGAHERLCVALWMLDELTESLEQGQAAVRLREHLADTVPLGETLTAVGPSYWLLGRTDDALAGMTRALDLLGSVPETPQRTFALVYHSLLLGLIGEVDALPAAEQAMASAGRTGVAEFLALSRTSLGRARLLRGEPDEGVALMRAGLDAAREARAHTFAMITFGLLVQDLFDLARFAECGRCVDEAIVYANECEVSFYVRDMETFRYRLRALRGEWAAATSGLRGIVGTRDDPETGLLRYALAPLAGLLARQGAEDAEAVLAWSRDFARRADCYYDWRQASMVEIEAAWSAGSPGAAGEAVARLDELTARRGRETERGELNRWKRRLGLPHEVPPGCPEMYAAGIRGDWEKAAAAWEVIGAPYEQALELLDSGKIDPTLRALEILDGLGAVPAARLARQRLRELGLTAIPRGPRAVTRANPAGLTERQLEILRLIARGLTNAEIAAHTFLSVRTVGHHVSAVLQKLDAQTRGRAAAIAREQGIDL